MKKRMFSMLVAAILLLGALAVNASAENATAVKEWSITLGDNIGANFYLNVPEGAADAAVKVTVAGQTNTCDLSEQNLVAEGLYKISVGVAAAQMTEDITLQLVVNGTEYKPVSYSVREYAERILAGNFSDETKTLVEHMLDYGAAAQTYFEVNTDKLANDGYELDYTAQYPEEYPELALNGQLSGIRLYGASLVMDSKVAVRYYFAADSVKGVAFSVNGVNYSAVEKDDMFYVEVPGIAPHKYADPIVLSAEKGEQKLEISYCPLTYIVRMSQKGREEMKALVNAMYGYYEAAIAYVDRAGIAVTLPTVTGGRVTADKNACQWGDVVTLTVTPDAGYSQKLYINGQPLLLDWKTNTYSFVATEKAYNITGSFEPSLSESPSDAARWDSSNQAHGVITTYYPSNNDSWWYTFDGCYQSIAVKAKNYWPVADSQDGNGNVGFATILRVTMDNGNAYAFRVINDKGTYAYDRYGGNGLTGWGGWIELSSLASQFNGDGVDFELCRTGDNILTLSVNGTVMETYTMEGITADNKVVSVSVQHNGNKGEKVIIPFVLEKSPDADAVKLNIADLTGGTVTANQESYKIGDTVTLTIAPDAGYSQKIFINDEPLLLDWKSNTYSFVAQKNTYNITGSFEPSLSESPSDAARWDSSNQAHGVITTYYPNNDNSWWYKINGGYQSIAVTAKNYLPQDSSAEGDGNIGYSAVLAATLDNGNTYAFRIINEKDSSTGIIRYIYTRFGASGSVTGWDGWCELEAKAPGVTEKLQADGAEFELTRISANILQITLDGVVLDTYTMDGVTDSNKVTSVGIYHYGNKGQKVEIPFTLVNDTDEAKFQTSDLSKYVIVYDDGNSDYAALANQLKTQISQKYGVALSVVSDSASTQSQYEILLGDTNRYDDQGRVMEYSVTVSGGHFRINVGGPCSAENAIAYLCEKVFTGQAFSLANGEYYKCSLLTSSAGITSGTTARVMTANVLADAFDDGSYEDAKYRVEIFVGMLVSYTPDVVGMQEVDASWSAVLDSYLTKIAKTHGIQYSRYLATYENKTNYTSLLYRSDKFKVEKSGVKVFTWWTNSIFNHNYHMRNVSWAQFSSLTNTSKKFIVANTHWSYNGEHVGKTLAGSSKALQSGDLKRQCKDEANAFLTSLKTTYSDCPIFVTGDFNTSLSYFTQWGWTAANYNVISQQAKSNGTALSTVPTSGHYDHIFGTGSYTVKRYEFFNSVNQHGALTDHPFAYADLAF